MRNLIICSDGTWNTPDQENFGVKTPSNVVRFRNAVAPKVEFGKTRVSEDAGIIDNHAEQVVYYHTGVGTDGGFIANIAGGAFGKGLSKNIMSAYNWLARNYEAGDRISMIGFSRGAYTVRSLSGMLHQTGLLDLSSVDVDSESSGDSLKWKLVEQAMEAYQERGEKLDEFIASNSFHEGFKAKEGEVYFLGVWDTVGALGIPNDLAILNELDRFGKLNFHDTELGDYVLNARHAVAADEERLPFSPTLWKNINERKDTVKQLWFPGVHSDVGGGYREDGLSNIALKWMIEEAAALGIAFRTKMLKQITPDHRAPLHHSFKGATKILKSRPRSMPPIGEGLSPDLHKSLVERQKNPPITESPYRQTLVLGEEGMSSGPLDIFAVEPWNETGLYLEAGATYRFETSGEWLDWGDASSPGGLDDGEFQKGDIVRKLSTVLGWGEKLWKNLTHNDEADFKFTRREEDLPWFSLVGAVANGSLGDDQIMVPHETIGIGNGTERAVQASGYLYCYANDSWDTYGNNKGSIQLTVTRVS